MLDLMAILGLFAFVVASLVVGMRILKLAWQTRGLPEMLIGASLALAGGIGTGLTVVSDLWVSLDADVAYVVYQLASICNHVGYALLFFFVWRVFRPEEGWAALLFSACTAVLAIGGIGLALTLAPDESNGVLRLFERNC